MKKFSKTKKVSLKKHLGLTKPGLITGIYGLICNLLDSITLLILCGCQDRNVNNDLVKIPFELVNRGKTGIFAAITE